MFQRAANPQGVVSHHVLMDYNTTTKKHPKDTQ